MTKKRILSSLLLAALFAGAHAGAQVTPLEPAKPLPHIATDLIFIPAKEARELPMAEWDIVQTGTGEQTGERVLIAEGATTFAGAMRVPEGASKYTARAYKFPTGAARVLTFRKSDGPVIHQITFESEIFMLQGSAEVSVRGEKVTLNKGDAVFLPSGVLRNMKPREDTVVLQFFVGSTAENPRASVVRAKSLSDSMITQWSEDGNWKTARTPQEAKQMKAPKDAAVYFVKRYVFDGNSIRHARLKKGGVTAPTKYNVDVIIYVNKGRMIRHENGQTFEVVAGDALREVEGATGYWEILEDSEFVATDAPFDPRKPLASP
jgi:quercetin dioxygenase-like cupin family protein